MRFRSVVLGVALAAWVGSVTLAQITVPFPTFVAGEVIDPDQVNSNFSTLSTQGLNRTGGTLTGNMAVSTNITIDGADISDYLDGSGNFTATGTGSITGAATFGSTTSLNAIVYTWPSAQTAGRQLRTNGSGTLTWANPAVSSQSSTFSASVSVDYYIVTATATVNLPACDAGNAGKWYHVKNTGAAATVTLDGNASETIDGATTFVFAQQYAALSIVCDGAGAWSIF